VRVIDSSVVIDVVAGRVPAETLQDGEYAAPHLIDSEVLHALRRLERTGRLTPAVAHGAVDHFRDLPLTRYAVDELLPRIWELRHNLSGYDATYVALAEALEATCLLTADERLARATGVRCAIELI
jgi:predicted nucleic acid-binding protein